MFFLWRGKNKYNKINTYINNDYVREFIKVCFFSKLRAKFNDKSLFLKQPPNLLCSLALTNTYEFIHFLPCYFK